MKKFLVVVIMVLLSFGGSVFASSQFSLELEQKLSNSVVLYIGSAAAFVNCNETMVDYTNKNVYPFIEDERTLVPVRFISESLGAKVDWNDATSTASISFNGRTVEMTIDSKIIKVNGTPQEIDVPAQIVNERTFIPLRALAEALGKKVFWNDSGLIVISEVDNILNQKALSDEAVAKFEEISGGSHYVKISREEAGLSTLEKSDFSTFTLNSRIVEIMNDLSTYKDGDYADGLVKNEDNILVSERFKDNIIGEIKIGTNIDHLKALLGKPSFTTEDHIFYKTKDYYIGFKGKDTVELAVIQKYPKACDEDILITLLDALESSDLNSVINDNPQIAASFEYNGHIHGGGWYAKSFNGVAAVEFADENTITIYNNFEGELCKDSNNNCSYEIVFEDEDYVVNNLRSTFYSYINQNEDFKTNGVLSPSGKLTGIYTWNYSESYCFTIRTNDNSKSDFEIGVPAGDYQWINDDYILYLNAWSTAPYIVKVDKDSFENINILYKVGIFDTDDYFPEGQDFDIEVENIDTGNNLIVLKDSCNDKTYNIRYTIDANNNISLKLAD